MMMTVCIKQHLSNIEAQFMKKLSNTEAELKNSVDYKKACKFNVILKHRTTMFDKSLFISLSQFVAIL